MSDEDRREIVSILMEEQLESCTDGYFFFMPARLLFSEMAQEGDE